MIRIGIMIALLALCSCSSKKYIPPVDHVEDNSIFVDTGYDETWINLIDCVSERHFSIERIDKESGLITLNFGSERPEIFVDCGSQIEYEDTSSVSQKLNLEGAMNISVREFENGTRVRVSARYVLKGLKKFGGAVFFDSGETKSIHLGYSGTRKPKVITCRPTYVVEKTILERIEELSE